MHHEYAGPRTVAARHSEWMTAWDQGVRGLLAERPGAEPDVIRPRSAIGVALGVAMFAALAAVVARAGPHPFLLIMFLAFATLYASLVPVREFLRARGLLGERPTAEERADLAEAATRSLRSWEETASRAVAAWHLAREAVLHALEPLADVDGEARLVQVQIQDLVPPEAPLAGVDVGTLRRVASTPLAPLPSLDGWGAVAGGVVYMARRKPFTLAEVLVVLCGVATVPPSLFLAIDGVAGTVSCAVLPPGACAEPAAAPRLFLLGMMSLTGLALLWRAVTRTRFDCPACGARVAIPRLAPKGRCHGCGRRVWVQWRK